MLGVLAGWAAITKYQRLGSLKTTEVFFLIVLEAEKSKIKLLAELVSHEDPLL